MQYVGVHPGEQEGRLQVGGRGLVGVSAYVPNISSEYLAYLETLEGVLEGASSGDTFLLLEVDLEGWRNIHSDMNLSRTLFFCANHSLSIINTMFEECS